MNEPIMITIPLDEYRFLLEMKVRNESNMFKHDELIQKFNNLERIIFEMSNLKK